MQTTTTTFVSAPSHLDYRASMQQDSKLTDYVKQCVEANCGDVLDAYSEYMRNRFLNNSGIVRNLTYGKVDTICSIINRAVGSGQYLYIHVAATNRKNVPQRPNQDADALFNYAVQDVERRNQLMALYDVRAILDTYQDFVMDEFLEQNPEFKEYPYKETNLISLLIWTATRDSYLLCLAACE